MATLTSTCNTVSNKIKLGKSHFLCVQGSFWSYLTILSFSFSLHGLSLQGEIFDSDYESFAISETSCDVFEGMDRAAEHNYFGSCCKKPIQGPPGPAFNSYISRTSLTVHTLSSFNFAPIDFEIPIVSSGDWTYSGTVFTSPTSGIYMVSFKVMFDMTMPFPGANALGIQLFNNLPFSNIYSQSFSELPIPTTGVRPITLESTFMINYVAGTPLTFAYFGADLTPFTAFTPFPLPPTGSASMAIFRIN